MKSFDFLIIGGGISGVTAAETLRAEDASLTIAIVDAESNPLYSRVQLPHYIKGLKTRKDVFLRSFEDYKEKNIELFSGTFASSINFEKKEVSLANREVLFYKKLLITTGGSPKKLNKYKKEYYMHTIEDADEILAGIKTAKKGIVIGSGFISLEFVGLSLHYGIPVTMSISKKGFWSAFLKPEVSDCIISALKGSGVEILTGEEGLNGVDDPDSFVGVGIGLALSNDFIAGSHLNYDDGIVADEFLRTSQPDVFTSGDVARFFSRRLGRPVRYGNWSNALVSGRFAAFSMLGKNTPYDQLSSYSSSVKGLSIVFLGFTGVDEKTVSKTQVYSEKECVQFFVREGKLDGCVLVNRAMDRKQYSEIIETRQDFNL